MTHSDIENECDRKEWLVEVTLSHSNGGVAVLFSKSSASFSSEVEEMVYGHILKVNMHCEHVKIIHSTAQILL